MRLKERIKDSFVVGMLSGLVTFTLSYFLISFIRNGMINYYSNPYIMKPAAVQLLSMGINIILFRVIIINMKRENTGKGFLFITVLISLAYFFVYFRSTR
jgi:hypothetical protein